MCRPPVVGLQPALDRHGAKALQQNFTRAALAAGATPPLAGFVRAANGDFPFSASVHAILHARAGPPQARVDILDGMLAFQRQMPSMAASPSARANVLRSRSRPENQTSGRTWRRSGMRGLTECALRRARFERHIEHIHRLVRQILGLVLSAAFFEAL